MSELPRVPRSPQKPMYTLEEVEGLPPRDACLTLLTDLSGAVPEESIFDFQIDNFPLCEHKAALALLIDNDQWSYHYHCRAQLSLSRGYHLLRAFLVALDAPDGEQCVKDVACYVEAEFFVKALDMPRSRGFMFGHPSLCHISPRGELPRAAVR